MMDSPDTPGNQLEPGPQASRDSGKLILPPPVQEYSPVADALETVARPRPSFSRPLTAKREVAPRPPLAKLSYYWRKDPAYKVFIIATCMVLIAGVVFVSLATSAIIHNPNLFSTGTGGVAQAGPTPTGTVDFRPTFPTPGGGAGSNQSSQPPVTSTPALPTTPTTAPTTPPLPTPTQGGGTLTVQITNIPSQVFNGQAVQVFVNTSVPGASVRIEVSYNVPPYFYVSATSQADGGGNAMLLWRVGVQAFQGHVVARVIAIAVGNGQRATSPQVTVQVSTFSVRG